MHIMTGQTVGQIPVTKHHRENSNPDKQCLTIWKQIVASYSGMLLSHNSDKLVALGGLADTLLPWMNDKRYPEGHWYSGLPESLLWSTFSRNHSSIYRAPSWSWASIDGQVEQYWDIPTEKCPKILVDVVHGATTPLLKATGPVSAGYLRVPGYLQPFTLPLAAFNSRIYLGDKATEDFARQVFLDAFHHKSASKPEVAILPVLVFDERRSCWGSFIFPSRYNHDTGRIIWIGLILELTFQAPDEYRRLGLMKGFLQAPPHIMRFDDLLWGGNEDFSRKEKSTVTIN